MSDDRSDMCMEDERVGAGLQAAAGVVLSHAQSEDGFGCAVLSPMQLERHGQGRVERAAAHHPCGVGSVSSGAAAVGRRHEAAHVVFVQGVAAVLKGDDVMHVVSDEDGLIGLRHCVDDVNENVRRRRGRHSGRWRWRGR